MEIVLAALSLGFLGSAHCLGMCGPIVLALPLADSGWMKRLWATFLYNFGRAITYALIGFVFGLFGKGLVLAGLQQWVSIVLGAIMIASVLFPVVFRKFRTKNLSFKSFTNQLNKLLLPYFQRRNSISHLIIGLLNGLLPCGLVYLAVAGAIQTGDALNGAWFMFLFGLGTIPALFTLAFIAKSAGMKIRKYLNKVLPVIIVLVGIVFVLRGLGLGIKYISPPDQSLQIQEKGAMHHSCH